VVWGREWEAGHNEAHPLKAHPLLPYPYPHPYPPPPPKCPCTGARRRGASAAWAGRLATAARDSGAQRQAPPKRQKKQCAGQVQKGRAPRDRGAGRGARRGPERRGPELVGCRETPGGWGGDDTMPDPPPHASPTVLELVGGWVPPLQVKRLRERHAVHRQTVNHLAIPSASASATSGCAGTPASATHPQRPCLCTRLVAAAEKSAAVAAARPAWVVAGLRGVNVRVSEELLDLVRAWEVGSGGVEVVERRAPPWGHH
jgi:hypothetical protein